MAVDLCLSDLRFDSTGKNTPPTTWTITRRKRPPPIRGSVIPTGKSNPSTDCERKQKLGRELGTRLRHFRLELGLPGVEGQPLRGLTQQRFGSNAVAQKVVSKGLPFGARYKVMVLGLALLWRPLHPPQQVFEAWAGPSALQSRINFRIEVPPVPDASSLRNCAGVPRQHQLESVGPAPS